MIFWMKFVANNLAFFLALAQKTRAFIERKSNKKSIDLNKALYILYIKNIKDSYLYIFDSWVTVTNVQLETRTDA